MTVVRGLYTRFKQLIHEFAKFGIIGLIGLTITNVGYALLHSHGVGPVTATTVATIVATIVAYFGNRYWSFKHRERTNIPREGLIFFVLNGIGLLIQDAVVAFNSYVLHLEHHKLAEFIALNTGIAIATVFRFWSYRRFVWADPGDAATAAVAVTPSVPDGPPTGTQPLAEHAHRPAGGEAEHRHPEHGAEPQQHRAGGAGEADVGDCVRREA